MKWPRHPNLRNRPPTPTKGRGPVQVRIRRAFIASGAEVLSSTQIYDWTHSRRRQSRRKKLPFGVYWRTLKTLRAMCEPVGRCSGSARARRYVFHPDEVAEAEAQGLPYILVPRILSDQEWMEKYGAQPVAQGESRNTFAAPPGCEVLGGAGVMSAG
jgi:hypothetical protein